jgi:hypothetical protein
MARLKPWVLGRGMVRDLLRRRDRIVARFEARARELGEDVCAFDYDTGAAGLLRAGEAGRR